MSLFCCVLRSPFARCLQSEAYVYFEIHRAGDMSCPLTADLLAFQMQFAELSFEVNLQN